MLVDERTQVESHVRRDASSPVVRTLNPETLTRKPLTRITKPTLNSKARHQDTSEHAQRLEPRRDDVDLRVRYPS